MTRFALFVRSIFVLALLGASPTVNRCAGEDQKLHESDLVALCGDSITEQARYSVFVATYLAACQPIKDVGSINFGVGGGSAQSFLETRLTSHVLPFHPDVATLCYGMNDSSASNAVETYRGNMERIVKILKEGQVRLVVLASPGVVDTFTYTKGIARGEGKLTTERNRILGEIGEAAAQIARDNGFLFADVHGWMLKTMEKAKAKYGGEYAFAGADGVHPDLNGHLVMAFAFLKALGCQGDIGTITLDLATGQAQATEGHKIISSSAGGLSIESIRYPFCFTGDPTKPSSTTGMLEFIPFNQDLNRLMLVVKNVGTPSLRVTWGDESRVFSAGQLATGINLAAEFLNNPFSQPFAELQESIRKKQRTIDTALAGPFSLLDEAAGNKRRLPEEGGKGYEEAVNAAVQFEEMIRRETARKIAPVSHTLVLEGVDEANFHTD